MYSWKIQFKKSIKIGKNYFVFLCKTVNVFQLRSLKSCVLFLFPARDCPPGCWEVVRGVRQVFCGSSVFTAGHRHTRFPPTSAPIIETSRIAPICILGTVLVLLKRKVNGEKERKRILNSSPQTEDSHSRVTLVSAGPRLRPRPV